MMAALTREDLSQLAEKALAEGTEEAAERRIGEWLDRHPEDAVLLHWRAMLRRALDRRDEAIDALKRALRIAPDNGGVLHALAHVTLEAGLPASKLFEQAIRLMPAKAELRLGLASARFAEGQGDRGLAELKAMLAANAGWMEGHRQFAQISALTGRADTALASIQAALRRFPQGDALRKLGIDLLMEAGRYLQALEVLDAAIAQQGLLPPYAVLRAAALSEAGRSEEADSLFEELGPPADAGHAVWLVRHRLRTGDAEAAAREIEPWLSAAGAQGVWPYAALAWRLTGDERAEWLDGRSGLCKVVDLDTDEIGLDRLRSLLRRLHAGSGRFLDQSVRGGTQTEGPLLARIDPEITRVREVLRREVARFASQLPPPDPHHPMLSQDRHRRPRFSGSWSVRLSDAGFHTAHHHPQGWISSALYLSVPDDLAANEGWLDIGTAPSDLRADLPVRMSVEPRAGRLVLFPSWMWHGTRPFRSGERLTIAFDVARA
jgi:Putative Zn-dependent protease, contains TPR repeats